MQLGGGPQIAAGCYFSPTAEVNKELLKMEPFLATARRPNDIHFVDKGTQGTIHLGGRIVKCLVL